MKRTQFARISYLDGIRGLMIIWMLVDHISLNYGYIKFGQAAQEVSIFTLMSFFMTPFYVFSGYLFSAKRNFLAFTMNKIRKLLVPYAVFTVFGIIIFESYSLYTTHDLDFKFIQSFIPTATFKTNTPCWFFISLFFVCELYYIVTKVVSRMSYGGGGILQIIIIVCFIIAWITKNHPQYFGYGNVLLGLVYFHLGRILNIHEQWIRKNKLAVLILSLTIYIGIGFFFPTSLSFVLNLLTTGYYFTNLMFCVSACLLLWMIAQKVDKSLFGKSMAYLGRISLVVFAFHRPILNWVIQPAIMRLNPSISYMMFLAVCLIILLSLSIVIEKFLAVHTPKLIGK